MPVSNQITNNIQKTFTIGSEWMYYKIYCGVKTADDVLLKVIQPICRQLLQEQVIDKWFFIRYSDPDAHLRVRFHVTSPDGISKIIVLMSDHINSFIETQQVWDIQLATYQRELKRYGATSISQAESVFFYDSEQVLYIIRTSYK
ncbi:thiopeptide-type bacteriocin biosynthesis protein [Nonlabens sp.]|uniref:thiopeptide-type bacteriocin biosynthesis protein n=1 Tax=Nonlabens sp. TaxID=1888209 RepID=UPI003F699D3E